MTIEGSIKFLNFMTPGAGVLVLGGGHIYKLHIYTYIHISYVVKMNNFFKNLYSSFPRHRSDIHVLSLAYCNDDQ